MPRKPTGKPRGRPRKVDPFKVPADSEFPAAPKLTLERKRALAAELRAYEAQCAQKTDVVDGRDNRAMDPPPTPNRRNNWWPISASASAIAAEANVTEAAVQKFRRAPWFLLAFISARIELRRKKRSVPMIEIGSAQVEALTEWLRQRWPQSGVWKIGRRRFHTPEALAQFMADKKMIPRELVQFPSAKPE